MIGCELANIVGRLPLDKVTAILAANAEITGIGNGVKRRAGVGGFIGHSFSLLVWINFYDGF
jgi:hypothetical protein